MAAVCAETEQDRAKKKGWEGDPSRGAFLSAKAFHSAETRSKVVFYKILAICKKTDRHFGDLHLVVAV